MNELSKEYIEKFLDEFMLIEYRGNDHIVARAHFREVFHQLLPKYFLPKNVLYKSNFIQEEKQVEGCIKNVVVIGAGYGGLTAALRLEKLLKKLVFYQIHLIDKNPYHTIKTQLHEAAVRNEEVSIPLDKILGKRNIRFHLGEVRFINVQNKIVHITKEENERLLKYDFLVIAIGSKVNYYNIHGMKEYSLPLQTLDDAKMIYEKISKVCALMASENDEQTRKENLRFVIGGGGLSGVEFAGELADHTAICISNFNIDKSNVEIILIEATERLIPLMDKSFSEKIKNQLIHKGVKILLGSKIIRRTKEEIFLSDGQIIKSKNFIWTGGIRVSDLVKQSGLKTSSIGRLLVDEYLQTDGDKHIYAIGDSANAINPYSGKPVPAAAQFALQQGRLVAKNILAEITGGKKEKYYPKVIGEVVSLGKHLAIGWLALPILKKVTFIGFLGRLLKAAIKEKHIFLLRKESRNWITY